MVSNYCKWRQWEPYIYKINFWFLICGKRTIQPYSVILTATYIQQGATD